MKKSLCIFSTILLIACFLFPCFAESTAQLYSPEKLVSSCGDKLTVPVYIKNNPGIMGFKLTVIYPEVLDNPIVQQSSFLSSGTFVNSITDDTDDKFDIVWNSITDVNGDGELFKLIFDIDKSSEEKDYSISIYVSQDDTFNEQWDDVILETSEIVFAVENQTGTELTEEDQTSETAIISNENLQTVIDTALNDVGVNKIAELDEDEFSDFKLQTDQSLSAFGIDTTNITEKEGYEKLYADAVTANAVERIRYDFDDAEISKVISETLQKYGANSIEDIPDEVKKSAYSDIISALNNAGAKVTVSVEHQGQFVDTLCQTVENSTYEDNNKCQLKNKEIIIIVAIFLIAIITVLLFVKKRKCRK